MKPQMILAEDDFILEFRTANSLSEIDQNPFLREAIGDDGYVLQEKIIIPPRLSSKAASFSASSIDPARCNPPLVLISHPDLPVQYTSFILRPKRGKAKVEKREASLKVAAGEINLLFSAPLFSKAEKAVESFSSAFDEISKVLLASDMKEAHIARTWLYLEDILGDYKILNKSREAFFARWYSSDNHFIPASTGIEGRVIELKPLAIQFCAFSGKRLFIRQQASPLQNEATSYGKLFSRCVLVVLPCHQLVYISGTASIDKTGASVHVGDFNKQMAFTLEILSAVLKEVRSDFSHVIQATVYLKNHRNFDACIKIMDSAGFPRARTLFQLDSHVCRDDLLCEIELTAAAQNK